MPVLGKKHIAVSEETHHQTAMAARERRMTIEQFVTEAVERHVAAPPGRSAGGEVVEVGEKYELAPHDQEFVERVLAWWKAPAEDPMSRAVKQAVAHLIGMPYLEDEIKGKRKRP